MANVLDEAWKKMRGFEIQAVGIASISYDDESKELINMRNKGAMLGDPERPRRLCPGFDRPRPGSCRIKRSRQRGDLHGHGHRHAGRRRLHGNGSQANLQQMQQQQARRPSSRSRPHRRSQPSRPRQPAQPPRPASGPAAAARPIPANSVRNAATRNRKSPICPNCGHDLNGETPNSARNAASRLI